MDEFDDEYFKEVIDRIEAHEDNTLVFVFKDGTKVARKWEHASRTTSWTPEMKEKARQQTLARMARKEKENGKSN